MHTLDLMGGYVAAIAHLAAETHCRTTLSAQDQPDIMSLHFDFLRMCELQDIDIAIRDLKVGSGISTIQLELTQKGRIRVVATATSTNFDRPFGPTVETDWTLRPPAVTPPNLAAVDCNQPDPNWLPCRIEGEIIPFTRRLVTLYPRDGFPLAGLCDSWNGLIGSERMDAPFVTLMTDYIPSMSDTLLHNGGLYDAHRIWQMMDRGAQTNPGVPAPVINTIKDAMSVATINSTLTLDIEFKKRIPFEGLQWTFTRTEAKKLADGRMDVELTICDDQMKLICWARQIILTLDPSRRFKGPKQTL
jgi:hypothetical protein